MDELAFSKVELLGFATLSGMNSFGMSFNFLSTDSEQLYLVNASK